MKIRNSFVSNSSSTSFILAVKKGKKCECCGCSSTDYVRIMNSIYADFGYPSEKRMPVHHDIKCGSPKYIILNFKESITQLENLKETVAKSIEEFKKISSDEETMRAIGNFITISRLASKKKPDNSYEPLYCQVLDIIGFYDIHEQNRTFESKIKSLERIQERIKEKIQRLQAILDKVKMLEEDEWEIFVTEMGNQQYPLKVLVEKLVEEGVAKIIEEINN